MHWFSVLVCLTWATGAWSGHFLSTCRSCRHFLPLEYSGAGDLYGKCKKFTNIHKITEEVDYDMAYFVRMREHQCGPNATRYEPISYPPLFRL